MDIAKKRKKDAGINSSNVSMFKEAPRCLFGLALIGNAVLVRVINKSTKHHDLVKTVFPIIFYSVAYDLVKTSDFMICIF